MKIIDLLVMGIKNLTRRKVRTSLTIIGVVIGTFAIVTMLSLGYGMRKTFTKQIMQRGSLKEITVTEPWEFESDKNDNKKKVELNNAAVEIIGAMDNINAVVPILEGNFLLFVGKESTYVNFRALDYSLLEYIQMPSLEKGSWPQIGTDYSGIILGQWNKYMYNQRTWEEYIPDYDNERVRYTFNTNYGYDWDIENTQKRNDRPRNIKVLGYFGESSSENSYYSYMDINLYKEMYRDYMKPATSAEKKEAEKMLEKYTSLIVIVDKNENVATVEKELKDMGYYTYSLNEEIEAMEGTLKTIELVLAGIGAVSLLVSAIGIANTMIMSIYERTKEIGVMKVLGCYVSDIKKLFLFEATLIGFFGGIIGVGLSFLTSFMLNNYGQGLFSFLYDTGGEAEPIETQISYIPVKLVVLAILFAMIIGMLSGYYPARRATKIRALEAIKTDN